jgi:dTDP-4-dehydrorhamnose reductase
MKKIIIFGSTGFLGSYLTKSNLKDSEIYCVERVSNSSFFVIRKLNDLSIQDKFECNEENVLKLLLGLKPDIIFNAAAIASIEQCALKPDLAFLTNAYLPGWISQYSSVYKCKFIHFSTDAVFGQDGSFFKESERPVPVSIYGKSKLDGEVLISLNDLSALIIRTNFFGWSTKKVSLFNFFYNALEQNKEVKGFINYFFTPIYVEELIRVTLTLIKNDASGLFHVTGNERISKFEFGQAIAIGLNKKTSLIKPSIMRSISSETFRNQDISLDNTKVRLIVGDISEYDTGIIELLHKMKRGW